MSKKDTEIKPCPFCGGKEIGFRMPLGSSRHYHMVCVACASKGPLIEEWNKKSTAFDTALARWNKRI
jgi:Lar family restriction alleviation protein